MLGETLGLIDIEGLKDGDLEGDGLGLLLGYGEYPLMLPDMDLLGLPDGETLGDTDMEGLTLGLLEGDGLNDALLLGDGLDVLNTDGDATDTE